MKLEIRSHADLHYMFDEDEYFEKNKETKWVSVESVLAYIKDIRKKYGDDETADKIALTNLNHELLEVNKRIKIKGVVKDEMS